MGFAWESTRVRKRYLAFKVLSGAILAVRKR